MKTFMKNNPKAHSDEAHSATTDITVKDFTNKLSSLVNDSITEAENG